MIDLKALVNKTVDFRFRGVDLRLDLSHALFSSFDIDVGTRLLFKAIGRDEVLASSRRILDAGSGVGVIGLGIAAAFPDSQVTLRDRDLLAVAFSERNRLRNKIANARVEAGLIGSGSLGGPWDYVLSNVPAKAGGPVIKAFLEECRDSLAPGGRLALVVVKPLVAELSTLFGTLGLDVLSEERASMHRAFVLAPGPGFKAPERPNPALSKNGKSPLDPGYFELATYHRRSGAFKLLGKEYSASGFWGLPDFDTIGFPQTAAAEVLGRFATGKPARKALVINPGIGHAALWIAMALGPESLTLASRDLLSLVAARENLEALGEVRGTTLPVDILDLLSLDDKAEGQQDLLLEFADPVPEYDWIADTWARALKLLAPGATFVIAAAPTELVRIEKRRPDGFRLLGEKRRKGSAAVAWRRNS
ncbi:MAG TPA: methyltransferase [Rectinemataceae bacterium]|nr:methyltransferase [Rectinemataceae bacterium]